MERQNVTISLPVSLLKKAKHQAIEEGSSLSALLASYIERLVDESAARQAAARRLKRRLTEGFELGTSGAIPWTRDELHER